MKEINILGTKYAIIFCNYQNDISFEKHKIDGYCDGITKSIHVCNMNTYPGYESESPEYCKKIETHILKHEIIHAFLNESGLQSSAVSIDGSWAENEEMVDFFACQFSKIYDVYKELGLI